MHVGDCSSVDETDLRMSNFLFLYDCLQYVTTILVDADLR